MESPIHVYSEIGKLKRVMLHRPGREIENITPDRMENLLFDDIPYLPIAVDEHDDFAQTLRDNGVETLYFEDLAADVFSDEGYRDRFLDELLDEAGFRIGACHDALLDYLKNLDSADMVKKVFDGVRNTDIDLKIPDLQSAAQDGDWPFLLNPLPNAYFTRDPQAAIGSGVSVNKMTYPARQAESLISQYIFRYHPMFKDKVNIWRSRDHRHNIEGGDELVLSDHVLAIGVSQRTQSRSITDIARKIFAAGEFDTVITIAIPKNHAMMHLDTVFTMVNRDQFTMHPEALSADREIDAWILHPTKDGDISMRHETDLMSVLKEALDLSEIDIITTGGGDPIVAPREQWNDGSNTLTIAPGEVVTYDRNYVSNQLLREHGILVHEVRSSELSRGRGGPRCMSCPLYREDL
ncbi:MAG: arginine deiminase [Limosilactobacillus sp.]|uniref:arginine deiminase n=1 Tax=Limosilactobacillus sp. TaxID=2773925 RepID=UPI00270B4F38|nr:arginine deiminase [Limosilactobacillus sp.]